MPDLRTRAGGRSTSWKALTDLVRNSASSMWRAPRRRTCVIGIVFAVVVAAASIGVLISARLTSLPEGTVLRVGDTLVSEADFQQRIGVLAGFYGVEAPTGGPERDQFERDAAQAVATSIVIEQAARARGADGGDAAREAVTRFVNGRFGGDRSSFARALGALRVSERVLQNEFHRQLVTDRIKQEVTAASPPVTDGEVAVAFELRRAQLVEPEQRRLLNIVVDSQGIADQLAARLREGEDAAVLARSESRDRSTSAAGGDLGFLTSDRLEPSVAVAAFGSPDGGVYGPVRSTYGWNVGRVAEVRAGRPRTLEEVRDPLRRQLLDERALSLWQRWLTDKVRNADIEYAERYRPANPATPPLVGLG